MFINELLKQFNKSILLLEMVMWKAYLVLIIIILDIETDWTNNIYKQK